MLVGENSGVESFDVFRKHPLCKVEKEGIT